MPSLTSVGGYTTLRNQEVLESFSMPQLTATGGLQVYNNDQLTSFDLSKLTSLEDTFYFRKNLMLAPCLIDYLLEFLQGTGYEGPVQVEANGTALTQSPCE